MGGGEKKKRTGGPCLRPAGRENVFKIQLLKCESRGRGKDVLSGFWKKGGGK